MNEHKVDAFRFTGRFIKQMLSAQIAQAPAATSIPWTGVSKPISACKVALLSTAGLSMRDDAPFDMAGERAKPTWGDPSWRRIDRDATSETIDANHLHIDTSYIKRDINVALPVDRLKELVADGSVGASADTHYSIMGFQGQDRSVLENKSGPEIADAMKSEEVDLAILAPV